VRNSQLMAPAPWTRLLPMTNRIGTTTTSYTGPTGLIPDVDQVSVHQGSPAISLRKVTVATAR
jgi:hypothetical protein